MENKESKSESPRPGDPEVKQVPFDEAQAINAEPHEGGEKARSLTPWRPEDAAHFLTQTIRESQRPLNEALAQRGVPTSVVLVGLVTMIFFAAGLMFLIVRLDRQVDRESGKTQNVGLDAAESVRWQQQIDAGVEKIEALRDEVVSLEKRLTVMAGERDRAVARAEAAEAKTEQVAEAGAEQIASLAEQLESQNVLGARLADVEELYRKSIEGEAARRKAADLRRQQLEAQAEEVASLRKQLKTAQELIRVLQGEEDGDALKKAEEGTKGTVLKEAVVPDAEPTADGAAEEKIPEDASSEKKDAVVEKE